MKYIILLVLLLVSFTAVAKDPYLVTTMTSESNQSLDDFAVAIAKKVSRESKLIDAELCGEFQKQGDVYVIKLYSVGRSSFCNYTKYVNDTTYTGLSYHTHLQRFNTSSFSESDYDHPGYLAFGSQVKFQNGRDTVRVVRR